MSEDPDAWHHEAKRAGLTTLSVKHLAQVAKAKAAANRMGAAIPRTLPMSVAPAHTFRASQEA